MEDEEGPPKVGAEQQLSTVYIRDPDGSLCMAVEDGAESRGETAGFPDAAATFARLKEETALLEAARRAIVAFGRAQMERSTIAFMSTQRVHSPVRVGKSRASAFMVLDALLWVLQWIVLAATDSQYSTMGEGLLAPLSLGIALAEVVMLAFGLESVFHGRMRGLAAYAIVQGSTIILLYRVSAQLWLFLTLRIAVLVCVAHLRVAIFREASLEATLRALQRQQEARITALTSRIDAVVAGARSVMATVQLCPPLGGRMEGALDGSQPPGAALEPERLMRQLRSSMEETHASLLSLRPLFEGIATGNATLLGGGGGGGGSNGTAQFFGVVGSVGGGGSMRRGASSSSSVMHGGAAPAFPAPVLLFAGSGGGGGISFSAAGQSSSPTLTAPPPPIAALSVISSSRRRVVVPAGGTTPLLQAAAAGTAQSPFSLPGTYAADSREAQTPFQQLRISTVGGGAATVVVSNPLSHRSLLQHPPPGD